MICHTPSPILRTASQVSSGGVKFSVGKSAAKDMCCGTTEVPVGADALDGGLRGGVIGREGAEGSGDADSPWWRIVVDEEAVDVLTDGTTGSTVADDEVSVDVSAYHHLLL